MKKIKQLPLCFTAIWYIFWMLISLLLECADKTKEQPIAVVFAKVSGNGSVKQFMSRNEIEKIYKS